MLSAIWPFFPFDLSGDGLWISHLLVIQHLPGTCHFFEFSCHSKVFLWTHDCPEKVRVYFSSHRRFPLLSVMLRDVISFILNIRSYTSRDCPNFRDSYCFPK